MTKQTEPMMLNLNFTLVNTGEGMSLNIERNITGEEQMNVMDKTIFVMFTQAMESESDRVLKLFGTEQESKNESKNEDK